MIITVDTNKIKAATTEVTKVLMEKHNLNELETELALKYLYDSFLDSRKTPKTP